MMRRAFSSGEKPTVSSVISGLSGDFVGIADPGKLLDLAAPRLRVHPLDVPLLTDGQRRVDEDLDELVLVHHRTHRLARLPVRRDRGTHHRATVAHDLAGHETYAQDVRIPVLSGETKTL